MSQKDDLETKRALLEAIPAEMVKSPRSIPVNDYIQKVEQLYIGCKGDRAELIAKGLSWEVVEDLPTRTRALLQAETLWRQSWYARETTTSQWLVESVWAYAFRTMLIHELRFAFQGNGPLLKNVREIASGTGHADMLMNLNALSELGYANVELLAATNFDVTLLAVAAQKADELTRLWANSIQERKESNGAKNLRDRAYTHVAEAADYVRRYGKYVFRFDPERLKAYRWTVSRKETGPVEPVPTVTAVAA